VFSPPEARSTGCWKPGCKRILRRVSGARRYSLRGTRPGRKERLSRAGCTRNLQTKNLRVARRFVGWRLPHGEGELREGGVRLRACLSKR